MKYDDINPHPRYLALLASIPTRSDDRSEVVVGISDDGAIVTAEYDDGRNAAGNETMGIAPVAFDLDYGHMVVSIYPSGNVGINLRGVPGAHLIVNGRPERVC